jgi:hypothetical protein
MKFISDGGGEYEAGDEAEIARTEALMQDARLDRLLDKLEGYLRRGGAKVVDRARLKTLVVEDAVLVYRGRRYIAERAPAKNLHPQLAEPLTRVIEILEGAFDIGDILSALGAPFLALGPEEQLRAAVRRYEDLLDYLYAIRLSLKPPEKRLASRPVTTGDVRALVDRLADYWESVTGKHFSPDWHRVEAANPSAAFVYDVVSYIDRDALRSVKTAAGAAVTRLRNPRK